MHKKILILFLMMLFLYPISIQAKEDIHIEITEAGIRKTPVNDIVLSQLMPGDKNTYILQLKNGSRKEQKLYLKLSAEKESLTEKIELQVTQNNRVLYKGTMQDAQAQAGFELGTYGINEMETIYVELHLPKDADNKLSMQQAAVSVEISAQTIEPTINTADHTRAAVIFTAMLISGAIIIVLDIKKKKVKKG